MTILGRTGSPRTALAVLALVLVSLGCSSSAETSDVFTAPVTAETTDEDSREETTASDRGLRRIADRPSTGGSTVAPVDIATVDLDEWTLTEADAEEALTFYHTYLTLSDAARLGDTTAAEELEVITDPLVRYMTEDWQSRNEQLANDELSILKLASTPNVGAISGSDEGAVVHDCVVQEVTDEFTQASRTEYVQQVTVLRRVRGSWLTSLVEVLHDGTLGSGPVRCVSNTERARVAMMMTSALDGLAEAWADPTAGADHLDELVGPDFLRLVDAEIGRMADEAVYADGAQSHTFDVLGAYLLADETSYLVASCTSFPEGLQRRAIATGEIVDDGSAPSSNGASPSGTLYREWTVTSTGDGSDERLVLATLDVQRVGQPCDEGDAT